MSGHIPQVWSYQWKHVQSGQGGRSQTDKAMTRLEFLELLNKWNSRSYAHNGANQWVYWE